MSGQNDIYRAREKPPDTLFHVELLKIIRWYVDNSVSNSYTIFLTRNKSINNCSNKGIFQSKNILIIWNNDQFLIYNLTLCWERDLLALHNLCDVEVEEITVKNSLERHLNGRPRLFPKKWLNLSGFNVICKYWNLYWITKGLPTRKTWILTISMTKEFSLSSLCKS